jgi:hypothetical protein
MRQRRECSNARSERCGRGFIALANCWDGSSGMQGMSCDRSRYRSMDFARGRLQNAEERKSVAAHAASCLDCRLFLEQQTLLTESLMELAADTPMAPPLELEAMLLAEFDSTGSWRRRCLKPVAAIVAIAAVLACFAVIQPRHASPPPAKSYREFRAAAAVAVPPPAALKAVPGRVRRTRSAPPAEDTGPFLAIPYTLPLDPRERMTVMRVEMPVTGLVAMGLTGWAPDPAASAQADVMVGEDGRIRAIRLVSLYNSDRRIDR